MMGSHKVNKTLKTDDKWLIISSADDKSIVACQWVLKTKIIEVLNDVPKE